MEVTYVSFCNSPRRWNRISSVGSPGIRLSVKALSSTLDGVWFIGL